MLHMKQDVMSTQGCIYLFLFQLVHFSQLPLLVVFFIMPI